MMTFAEELASCIIQEIFQRIQKVLSPSVYCVQDGRLSLKVFGIYVSDNVSKFRNDTELTFFLNRAEFFQHMAHVLFRRCRQILFLEKQDGATDPVLDH